MQLVIISGRSGSGKSTALNVLEDIGFTCIDNLPASLLPTLIKHNSQQENMRYAVSIDARNLNEDLKQLPNIILTPPISDLNKQLIFLDAKNDVLLQRFSETRRKHPLSNKTTDLHEAFIQESELLKPILDVADIAIDTSDMKFHDLRNFVKRRFMAMDDDNTSIMFQSFGFKYGIPKDADMIFDVRCLPNPHWEPKLRQLTGQDHEVKQYLDNQAEVTEMFNDIKNFLSRWLPSFKDNNRSYITVGIGCTGGQHRSVYLCEKLSHCFDDVSNNIQYRHRELS